MKGLNNINASCFMNTVLQGLFASQPFNDEVLRALAVDKTKTLANPVICAYCLVSKSLVMD